MAADEVRRFGVPPKVAFLSHSDFGCSNAPVGASRCARRASCSCSCAPDIECDGECMATRRCRRRCAAAAAGQRRSTGERQPAGLPNLDAANILFNVLKMTGGHGVTVGPILLGAARRRTS